MPKIYDVEINDLDFTGVNLISIVEDPAVEVMGVKLSKETVSLMLKKDDMKQYLTAVVLIPNKLIPRFDQETNQSFSIRFSAEVIEKIRNKFHALTGDTKTSNFNHDPNQPVNATLIESWIKTSDQDKSVAMGFGVPVGTWMATYHVHDENFWKEQVMSGEVGFSVEAILDLVKVKMEKLDPYQEVEFLLDELLDELNKL